MDTTRSTVMRIVADVTGHAADEIDDSSRLAEDLRLKSANRIELTVLISDELGVQLSIFDALKAKTVGDLIAVVGEKLAPTATQPS